MVGVGVDDRLADELQHQPQHAVRAGVLRPHVDGHRFGAKFRHRRSVQATGCQIDVSVDRQLTVRPPVRRSHGSACVCTSCTRAVLGVGHVDVDLRQPRRSSRRRARSARSSSARAPGGLAAPRSTFGDSPLVVMPSATSPGRPERLDLPREHAVEPVVVGDRRQRRSCRSSAPSPPAARAFALEPADQLGGEVLRVGGAAAVAEHQHLAAVARAPSTNRRGRVDHRLPVRSARIRSCSAMPASNTRRRRPQPRSSTALGITRARAAFPRRLACSRRTLPPSPAAARTSSPSA